MVYVDLPSVMIGSSCAAFLRAASQEHHSSAETAGIGTMREREMSTGITQIVLVLAILALCAGTHEARGQDGVSPEDFDGRVVLDELDADPDTTEITLRPMWWQSHVSRPFSKNEPMPTGLHNLLLLAIHNSHRIKIAKQDPLIRQTAIQEASANFDWVQYLDSTWNDSSEPIGSSLTVGGTVDRFEDHTAQLRGGLRRTNEYGGTFDLSQQMGWQDNNSQFLTPQEQATGRLALSYTQPLLRGRGKFYNTSVVFLARIDSEAAKDEFLATLQDELFEITSAYWELYLERAYLSHQISLYLKTMKICELISARRNVDAQPTQMVAAQGALTSRRADLIRSRTNVTNVEMRLRGLINAPELGSTDVSELLPSEFPSLEYFPATNVGQIQMALQMRPELDAAVRHIKAASRRLGIARQEMLPALNLVTQVSTAGLRGNSNFGSAFGDQFAGSPSYSIGLQYELPIGNRAAKARVCRRQHEVRRLQAEFSRATEAIKTEVDLAVRELNTTYLEIGAKNQALMAAEAEATTIEQRWLRMVDGRGTASLNLESLLRAQERVTEAEREYAAAIVAYNLSLDRLKRSNGTLLRLENVSIRAGCENGCNSTFLNKGDPAESGVAPIPIESFPHTEVHEGIPQVRNYKVDPSAKD